MALPPHYMDRLRYLRGKGNEISRRLREAEDTFHRADERLHLLQQEVPILERARDSAGSDSQRLKGELLRTVEELHAEEARLKDLLARDAEERRRTAIGKMYGAGYRGG